MSKKVGAELTCLSCKTPFAVELYRSVWIDDPRNRDLIFSDQINRFRCPGCNVIVDPRFAFLAVNLPKRVAVWYEPAPDPQIDADNAQYRKHMGENSFYSKAPRVRDWAQFKQAIVDLEATPEGGGDAAKLSPEMFGQMMDFVRSLRGKNTKR